MDGLTIRGSEGFLQATFVVEALTRKLAFQLLAELGKACRDEAQRRVLLEWGQGCLRMSATDAYDLAQSSIDFGINGTRIAWLVGGDQVNEDAHFYEVTAANHGVTCKFFTEKADALDWLMRSVEIPETHGKRT